MKIFHLIKVRFDRRTAAATQEWLDNRYKFFAENTLKSLQDQTFKDWTLWINCQDGMQDMIEKLREVCPMDRRTLFSYGDGAVEMAEKTGPSPIQAADYVYVTRIDSDDLFSSDAMAIINALRPTKEGAVEAGIFRRGYMLDTRNKRLGVYYNPSSPFHVIMFPRHVFTDPRLYDEVWQKTGDHSWVARHLPHQVLPHWKFTVLIHGNNFLSDFNYGREPGQHVEKHWSLGRFMAQPVTFDVDDFCDRHNCLDDLFALKNQYPNFKATLFTIPTKTSPALLKKVRQSNGIYPQPWIELAVHGISHEPNEEMKAVTPAVLSQFFRQMGPLWDDYTHGFRPPGWWMTQLHAQACSDNGLWVACHLRDQQHLAPPCKHGHYVCDSRPYWHGHTHDVCGNWIRKCLPELLTKWPKDQAFSFVSESILVPQT